MLSKNRWWLGLLIGLFGLTTIAYGNEPIPDDIRYMLEDIYGSEKNKWPKPVYSEDVNGDGLPDWLAQHPGCKSKGQCSVDLFLCSRAEGQHCKEYCYVGSAKQTELLRSATSLKCQSTC